MTVGVSNDKFHVDGIFGFGFGLITITDDGMRSWSIHKAPKQCNHAVKTPQGLWEAQRFQGQFQSLTMAHHNQLPLLTMRVLPSWRHH